MTSAAIVKALEVAQPVSAMLEYALLLSPRGNADDQAYLFRFSDCAWRSNQGMMIVDYINGESPTFMFMNDFNDPAACYTGAHIRNTTVAGWPTSERACVGSYDIDGIVSRLRLKLMNSYSSNDPELAAAVICDLFGPANDLIAKYEAGRLDVK